ncbi:unnamed protein product [Hyaloperonospora brassicae]|uniref:Uncharacterized protein n=1 Tax=Hyaloperonospora brassicae TaxID=162125 RepID=A0AAV0TY21_HYABA|nr:unnamed protein product [Hyaloperonospora brassicae]
MDTFLQLDASGVYDDHDLAISAPVDLETQIQRHVVETSPTGTLFGDHLYPPVAAAEAVVDTRHEQLRATNLDAVARRRYLERVLSIETEMREADKEIQRRIDGMKRILALEDCKEQLSQYMALEQEVRRDDDAVDIVEDLLQCADRMTKEEDSEVATLGAFFFLCDKQRHGVRQKTTMLPVVVAMMEALSGRDHNTSS